MIFYNFDCLFYKNTLQFCNTNEKKPLLLKNAVQVELRIPGSPAAQDAVYVFSSMSDLK